MKELLFKRVIAGNCPICDKSLKEGETVVVDYNDGKLEVHKKHIKYESR